MPSRLPGSPRPWLLPTPAGRAGRRLGTGVGWRVQASAVAAGSALSSSLKAASSWEASVCARRIFGPRSHPARPGLGGRGAVSIRVPSRCSGGGAEGTRRSLFLGWGASRFHRGTPAGTARGSGPAPSRSLLAVAAARWPGLRPRAFLGGGAVGPGSQPARGRAGPVPSPAHGAGSVRTAPPSFPATGPCHARRRRDLVKGLALSLLACSEGLPVPLSSVRRACFKRPQSESGTLEVPAVGVLFPSSPCPLPLLYTVDVPPARSPLGLGPGLGLPFSPLRGRARPRGAGNGPRDLPGRSERDVYIHSPVENRWPRDQAHFALCILF